MPTESTISPFFSSLYIVHAFCYCCCCCCIDKMNWLGMKCAAYEIELWCGSFISIGVFFHHFSFDGKIAGKTIQHWAACRMEMIDNVLYAFTWNSPLVSLAFFVCISLCFVLPIIDGMLMPLFATISTYAFRIHNRCERKTGRTGEFRLKFTRYVKLIPKHRTRCIFTGNGRYLHHYRVLVLCVSEKANRAANDWMKMQNDFSHMQTNPVATSNCKLRR